jgi:hypothetical protein
MVFFGPKPKQHQALHKRLCRNSGSNSELLVFLVCPLLSIQAFQMEVAALLFASKCGVAAFASVILAITLWVGGLGLLVHKANKN